MHQQAEEEAIEIEDAIEHQAEIEENGTGQKIASCIFLTDQKGELYKNYENANSQVEKGIFWEHPPQRIVKPKDKKTCWKDHFQMSVFHWIPSAMLGKEWRPTVVVLHVRRMGTIYVRDIALDSTETIG